jgi:type IV pilus assembly protein PilV
MTSTGLTTDVRRHTPSISGFTLIEVLVTLAIIAIGLLGLGAFQARVQQAELEAYNRAQALVLLNTIVNRINTNRQTGPCYVITTGTGTPYLGYADGGHAGTISCVGYGDVNTQAMAVADLNDWDQMLQGATEAVAVTNAAAGGALGARGCISYDGGPGTSVTTYTYTVVVAWQGMTPTVAPTVACGNNAYGQETLRRVVWTTFKVAKLL